MKIRLGGIKYKNNKPVIKETGVPFIIKVGKRRWAKVIIIDDTK